MVRTLARGRGSFQLELVGLLELKGLPEPIAACELRWERAGTAQEALLPLPPSLVSRESRRFVGREAEMSTALECALGSETAHALWILGEPGIGKTRLAAEVASRAHAAGATVLFGRCDELVPDPFQPIIEALRYYVANTDDAKLAASLGVDPEPLVRLVPELATRLPELASATGRATEVEQYRLFESVQSWMQSISAERQVVFVIDDVHWADRPTLALLGHTLRSPEPTRLLVVGTARSTDPDASELLAGFVDDLARTGRSDQMLLSGLATDEIALLLANAELGGTDATGLASQLSHQTAGNPLFVDAMLAGLTTRGASSERSTPSDVRSAVDRRTRRLDTEVQDRLQIAALVGLEFSLRLTSAVVGVDETECLSSIERAMNAGLVEEVDVDRFRFTHALVRDALAAQLSASRSARLHVAIAETIEDLYQDQLDDHLRSLAHHYATGTTEDTLERALGYARRAARRSRDLLAFDAAIADWELALELQDRLPETSGQVRYELLIEKGQAQRTAARHSDALDTLRAAAELARDDEDWLAFARAAIAFEETSWRPGLPGHAAAVMLEEAETHAESLPPDILVRIRSSRSRALHFSGRDPAARELATAALEEARGLGDQTVLMHALSTLAQTQTPFRPSDLALATAIGEEAWSLRDVIGISEFASLADYGVERSLLLGDAEGLALLMERAATTAEQNGLRFDRYVLHSEYQILAFLEGRLDEAESRANANLELGRDLGEDLSGSHGVQMYLIRREQGRLDEIAPAVRMLLDLNPAGAMWRPGLISLLAALGMREKAAELLAELSPNSFGTLPHDAMYPAALSLLAEAAFRTENVSVAEPLTELLEEWRGIGVSIGHTCAYLGCSNRYLALLAQLLGHDDDAESDLAYAVEHERGLGAVTWEAHTLADWAALRARRGDDTGAHGLVAQARPFVERYGLVAVGRQLDALEGSDLGR
jgi:tetratricopeptide (TPR) repeat protein